MGILNSDLLVRVNGVLPEISEAGRQTYLNVLQKFIKPNLKSIHLVRCLRAEGKLKMISNIFMS